IRRKKRSVLSSAMTRLRGAGVVDAGTAPGAGGSGDGTELVGREVDGGGLDVVLGRAELRAHVLVAVDHGHGVEGEVDLLVVLAVGDVERVRADVQPLEGELQVDVVGAAPRLPDAQDALREDPTLLHLRLTALAVAPAALLSGDRLRPLA